MCKTVQEVLPLHHSNHSNPNCYQMALPFPLILTYQIHLSTPQPYHPPYPSSFILHPSLLLHSSPNPWPPNPLSTLPYPQVYHINPKLTTLDPIILSPTHLVFKYSKLRFIKPVYIAHIAHILSSFSSPTTHMPWLGHSAFKLTFFEGMSELLKVLVGWDETIWGGFTIVSHFPHPNLTIFAQFLMFWGRYNVP